MKRDEARDKAWSEFRERCDRENVRISRLLEWKLFYEGFDAGYQSREDVASALKELVEALPKKETVISRFMHQRNKERFVAALSNAERLLNGEK